MSLNEIENSKGWAARYHNQGWMTNPTSQQDFSYRNLMMANSRGRPMPGQQPRDRHVMTASGSRGAGRGKASKTQSPSAILASQIEQTKSH